jgi:tRNA nucleotidyltransferase (CCA-adding enzyme)
MDVKINLPMQVQYILNTLNNKGYEAYVVGGCVRDSLLGVNPKDWDICTSAKPEEIIEVFKGNKIIPTGLKHGTITLVIGINQYEITTYRVDGLYSDGRHPDNVEFVSNLEEDLSRRDFTINAMAYSHAEGLVDLFGGENDLKNRVIKCVGNAKDRFAEDALRMLRAYRFAARYGFKIDGEIKGAIEDCCELIKNISIERIQSEAQQVIGKLHLEREVYVSSDFYGVNIPLFDEIMLGVLELLSIRLDIKIDMCILVNLVMELIYCPEFIHERVAYILHYIQQKCNIKPEDIMDKLKVSNYFSDCVHKVLYVGDTIISEFPNWRVLKTDRPEEFERKSACKNPELRYKMRKYLRLIGNDKELLRSVFNYILAINFTESEFAKDDIFLANISLMQNKIFDLFDNEGVYDVKYLALNGNDLMELGYSGKQIGGALAYLLDMVMRGTVKNTKPELIKLLRTEKQI